jgi:hypothetical protein
VDTRKPNPGPPLAPEEEFCACQLPSGLEYLKASGVTLLLLLVGAGAVFGTALLSGRTWSFLNPLLGLVLGLAVNWAAGHHRSVWLGLIAAGGTGLATGVGYLALLGWQHGPISWGLPWSHVVMIAVGGLVAYRLAGPNAASRQRL